MKKNNDSIQFESRREIETLMLILQEWQEEHPGDGKEELAQEIFDDLEVLHMCW